MALPAASLPPNEAERVAALRTYQVLDNAADGIVGEILSLAARMTDCPTALVTLIDSDRQWFLDRIGFAATETPRDLAFCAHAILQPSHPTIVADATQDPRFTDNGLVTGPPGIRAYLGVPLVNPEGLALGTLCVIDYAPRSFDDEAVLLVSTLSRAVSVNLELRRSLVRAQEMALTDPLTGLPNRRAMMDVVSTSIARDELISVIAVDLDHFKETNDIYGHAAGDALLQAAATRLKQAVRAGDFIARTGGDEFTVILPGTSDDQLTLRVARRISASLHRPFTHKGRQLRPGATCGVAVATGAYQDPDMVIRFADTALIRAKRNKRGSIEMARGEESSELLRASVILRAFDEGTKQAARRTKVHLQPIVALDGNVASGANVIAVEALARWNHPGTGDVPPIELFETIGPDRAIEVSRTARVQAMTAFTRLNRGDKKMRLAVNLSAAGFMYSDVGPRVTAEVQRAGLSLSDLELEITEEVLLDRISLHTLDQLGLLHEAGARLILDDFGTGNSGLAQLLRLPLDGVKLDKRFVQRLGRDARAEAVLRAMVSMAHDLGLHVVAEGVETERQLTILQRIGCDAVQGFLVARPMPPDPLDLWLARQRDSDPAGLVSLRPSKVHARG